MCGRYGRRADGVLCFRPKPQQGECSMHLLDARALLLIPVIALAASLVRIQAQQPVESAQATPAEEYNRAEKLFSPVNSLHDRATAIALYRASAESGYV